ncbi:MAG: hypothetical protein V4454_17500 [Pseudomonadota bacterium]
MNISPFFTDLRSAYQAELDDLRFDSEGRDVLRQRLADKRQELGFLVNMMELSPEMVAVVLHQGFNFRLPAVMDHLLTHEADEFPEWISFSDAVGLAPWAQDVADVVLQEPGGEWFMTVAAGLEYMAGRPSAHAAATDDDEDSDDEDGPDEFDRDEDGEEHADSKARKEAGDDWMAEQGFDRKD